MDLTTLLQGGALAAVVAVVGPVFYREIRRALGRKALRAARRSPAYRETVGLLWALLPYAALALITYAALGVKYLILIPIPLVLASITRRAKRPRMLFIILSLAAALIAGYILPAAAIVVLVSAALRWGLPIILGGKR